MVGHVWGNVPVLPSPSGVSMQPCESVVNCPLPCESHRSVKMFKICASDFSTVSMCRRFHAYAYEVLTTVTEGVAHGVHKIVIRLSFGEIQQHKVS